MFFKNNIYSVFTLLSIISCFSNIFAHNLQRRQIEEEQNTNCVPLEPIQNGKIIPLSQEYNGEAPVPNQAIFKFACDENYDLIPEVEVIKCIEGSWNNTTPNCLPKRSLNEVEGSNEVKTCGAWDGYSQAPWHVGIYEKVGDNYEYFCGGTIVSPNVIVTAAHCLTDDEGRKINANDLYIGAGKHKSDYNAEFDWTAQHRQAQKYEIPETYKGAQSNLEGDIALIVLKKPFSVQYFVQPACIDWEDKFENEQLTPGNIGHVQGWGYTNLKLKTPSFTLQQLNVPVIEKQQCLNTVPKSFHNFVTEDKFCAGYTNGSCICNGDDGGGLIFGKMDPKGVQYYIRGLVSTFPKIDGACDAHQYALYTKISSHKNFIKHVINENKIKTDQRSLTMNLRSNT